MIEKLKDFDLWDFWEEKTELRGIEYKNGEIVNKINIYENGIGVRINGVYYYSTNSGEESLKIKPPKTKVNIRQSKERGRFIVDYDVDLEEVAKDIIYFLKDEKIKYDLQVAIRRKKVFYTNSAGCKITQTLTYNGIFLSLYYKERGELVMIAFKDRHCFKPVSVDFEKLEEKIKILKNLPGKKHPNIRNKRLILDPEICDLLIHEAYGHALEKDHIEKNESVFSRNREAFLGENVTIIENPLKATWGFYMYDDEGFKAKEKVLIKNGKIVNFIEDGRYGEGGHGRKENYKIYPIPRMACTILEPGDYSFEEMVEELKDGYILKGFAGGEVNPKSGYFHFMSEYAYEVKNGEIVGSLKGTAFSDNILEVGKKIVVKSKEVEESTGICGKDNQHVPVSAICPYVLIENA